MRQALTVGLIGDQLPEYSRAQNAAVEMVKRAAAALDVDAEIRWFPTPSLDGADVEALLGQADALWASPGSPYLSLEGGLRGIRFARERGWPFLGTCAGFQHAVLEYARNVTGIADATHEEYDPEARILLLTALVCPIATKTLQINLLPRTRAAQIYARTQIEEYYYCNFGLNPDFEREMEESGLKITGKDQNGEPRVVELPEHRFYVATLFVPGASAVEGVVKLEGAHPLVKAFLAAGLSFRAEKGAGVEARLGAVNGTTRP